jgi:hypothetical protein
MHRIKDCGTAASFSDFPEDIITSKGEEFLAYMPNGELGITTKGMLLFALASIKSGKGKMDLISGPTNPKGRPLFDDWDANDEEVGIRAIAKLWTNMPEGFEEPLGDDMFEGVEEFIPADDWKTWEGLALGTIFKNRNSLNTCLNAMAYYCVRSGGSFDPEVGPTFGDGTPVFQDWDPAKRILSREAYSELFSAYRMAMVTPDLLPDTIDMNLGRLAYTMNSIVELLKPPAAAMAE